MPKSFPSVVLASFGVLSSRFERDVCHYFRLNFVLMWKHNKATCGEGCNGINYESTRL